MKTMDDDGHEWTRVRLRADLRDRLDERVKQLTALGLQSSREALMEASMNDFLASPKRREIGAAVLRDLRLNHPSEIPAEVRDGDLLVNCAVQMYLRQLEEN